jgi:hypothetical protein
MHRILSLAALAVLAAGPLRGQAAPDTIKLRNDCRLAEQALRTGHPRPKVGWARTFLPNCQPQQWASASSAALDRLRTSTNDGELTQEWGAVSMLRDAGLLTVARSVALDRQASTGARVQALRYLAGLLDERGEYSFDLLTDGVPTSAREVHPVCSSGRAAGGQTRFTGVALPSDYRQQIRDVGVQVKVAGAPEAVRRAGECVVYVADGNSI